MKMGYTGIAEAQKMVSDVQIPTEEEEQFYCLPFRPRSCHCQ